MEAPRAPCTAWKGSSKTSTWTSPERTSPRPVVKCGATSHETSPDGGCARYTCCNLVCFYPQEIVPGCPAVHPASCGKWQAGLYFCDLSGGDDLPHRARSHTP